MDEETSLYQYVQVVEKPDGRRQLFLNEGVAVHSLWYPNSVLTGGIWDTFLALPPLLDRPLRNVAILGNAAAILGELSSTSTTRCYHGRYMPDDLVSGNTREMRACPLAADLVQIGVADAAICDVNADVMGAGRAAGDLDRLERLVAVMGAVGIHKHWRLLFNAAANRSGFPAGDARGNEGTAPEWRPVWSTGLYLISHLVLKWSSSSANQSAWETALMARRNLNDLLAFVTVAREGSFTRAAKVLGVTQSALSQTIRGLEDRLDIRLLTRTTRSVSPTAAGERLANAIGHRLEEIEAELDALTALRDKPAGAVRITCADQVLRDTIWPKLVPLLKEYPDISSKST